MRTNAVRTFCLSLRLRRLKYFCGRQNARLRLHLRLASHVRKTVKIVMMKVQHCWAETLVDP